MALSQTIVWTAAAAVISAASMAGGYITSQVIGPEHRITAMEQRELDHERQDDGWRDEVKDYRNTINAKLDRIDSKIDRLIERDISRRAVVAQQEDQRERLRGGK